MVKKDKAPKIVKLDLACGFRKTPGFTGVDLCADADIKCDLEIFPWPFKNGSVDEIVCNHYVEHTADLVRFMDETYRILKVGGKCSIQAPYYSSFRATMDPTHRRNISEMTFLYFNKEWREKNLLGQYAIKSDFDFSYGYILDPEWNNRSRETQQFAIKHYINVVTDINVILTKREEK